MMAEGAYVVVAVRGHQVGDGARAVEAGIQDIGPVEQEAHPPPGIG